MFKLTQKGFDTIIKYYGLEKCSVSDECDERILQLKRVAQFNRPRKSSGVFFWAQAEAYVINTKWNKNSFEDRKIASVQISKFGVIKNTNSV